ncbi:hypothetical protein lacNasYZ03_18050 [Lactobacillus nasalidis]|uniref:Uncharacterized protein n=1 Tax=Lactobacillus nasalidis TaxID=2797258 RepID=A0ABQ3W6E1_9LACO|nr:hypothetical protein [Lactobacillus nasalidis]GHV97955.1 hypothetical protein lacNasYZ01_11370 [Lactobacillus nasalidis]GHV99379.1 hypothetical protein lacNasYZ02_08090 [Lactobacillus nasalidis]GHW02118.1 hypothetical protein lacNasYZ03_18050 [Lactobacillus nasalidis]
MAESSGKRRRRNNYEIADNALEYKKPTAFIAFLLLSLLLAMGTFLNPAFMKQTIKTDSNTVVVSQQVNSHFNRLATIVNGSSDEKNLISDSQARQVADLIIDYKYGWHFVQTSNLSLAKDIKTVILKKEKTDTDQVAAIRKKLKKQKSSSVYIVSNAFDLATVMLEANLITIVRIVNILVILLCLVALFSILRDAFGSHTKRAVIHDMTAGLMWAAFWFILLYGLLAMVPIFMDTSVITVADLGYWLEIASGVFLDFVIAGVIMYVVSAIPWQITSN